MTHRGGSRSSRRSATPTAGISRSRSATCRRGDRVHPRAEKDEKVLVRYRHERGENTYKATFEGIITNLERRYRETDSEYIKTELEKYMVTGRARPARASG
jgi:excinuclease UvrABC ATPase subunit